MPGTCSELLKPEDEDTQHGLVGSGVLDNQNLAAACEHFTEWVDKGKCRSVLLNFAHISYLSSIGLCRLLTLRNTLSAKGGQLFLCNLNANIREIFEVTKLKVVFNIQDEEAVLMAP